MKGERGRGGYKPNLETLIYAGLPNARFLIFNLPFRTHGRGAINYSQRCFNGIWKCVGRDSDSMLFQMAGTVRFALGTLDK